MSASTGRARSAYGRRYLGSPAAAEVAVDSCNLPCASWSPVERTHIKENNDAYSSSGIPRSTPRRAWPCRRRRSASRTSRCSTWTRTVKHDAMGVVDLDPRLDDVWPARRPDGFSQRRQRATPLRLECVQRVSLPAGGASAHGAPLPDCSGHRIVADSHPRYESRTPSSRNS